jgi:hypothetical protein
MAEVKFPFLSVAVAALAGAAVSALISERIIGPALTAQGSKLEMGGIPLLLSAIVFAPLLAAMVAGLLSEWHPYWAGFLAQIGLVGVAVVVQEIHGHVATTIISPAPLPFYAVIGLWGSLIVDAELRGRAARFRALRDGSITIAGIISFLALLGAAIYWPPALWGLVLDAALVLLFFGWIVRRNRQAQKHHAELSI